MSKQNLVSNAAQFSLVCVAASAVVSQAALADPTLGDVPGRFMYLRATARF